MFIASSSLFVLFLMPVASVASRNNPGVVVLGCCFLFLPQFSALTLKAQTHFAFRRLKLSV